MAKTDVKNLDGKTVGNVDLDDAVFGVEVNEHLLWEVVKAQRAKQRGGNASTKRRNEVSGGGKKPWKQKGTGRARQGSTRAPNFVGGGSVFGPKPRDFEYHLPKKAMAVALRSALSLRAKQSKIVVVDKLELKAIKTQKVAAALEGLGSLNALIVDGENENLAKSTRNLARAKYLRPEGLTVYNVLAHDTLVLSKDGLDAVTLRLRPREEGAK
jgi:large subunit ribosomal protein L4